MRPVARIALVVTLAVLASACAGASGSGGSRTVTVGREDAGTTVLLHRGDHLVLDLGPSSLAVWKLLRYPTPELSLRSSEAERGRFDFSAESSGEGGIVALVAPSCGPPGALAAPECPVGGGDPADGIGGKLAARAFTVTVQVA